MTDIVHDHLRMVNRVPRRFRQSASARCNRCSLRSDEPQADQHQHAGQDGEQEAIGNAGRQVATD
jgi:hypothetical protein